MKKRKIYYTLWFHLILSLLGITFFSALFTGIIAFILYKAGVLFKLSRYPFVPIIIILFSIVIISTLVCLIYGKKMIKPIIDFNEATKEIANGNFNIVLSSCSKSELGDLTNNFNKMIKELNSIQMLRNDFITNVSHEIKTPITSILGYATLLQDESLSKEERMEYTNIIIDSSKQLSVLTSNILKLSKLENQEIPEEKHSFLLDEQLRKVILLLEPEWSKKALNMNIHLEEVKIFGYEDLLFQVWLNLIHNAIKYTNEIGTIQIIIQVLEQEIIVRIQDSGIGMDQETLKHIFDKFYQADPTRHIQGNGLGLALVKRIIEIAHYELNVESTPSEGSTFTVHIPKNTKK